MIEEREKVWRFFKSTKISRDIYSIDQKTMLKEMKTFPVTTAERKVQFVKKRAKGRRKIISIKWVWVKKVG